MTRITMGKLKDPRPKIKNCTVPFLIMKAQCDNQKWGYITEYMELFPNFQLSVFKDAGHNIFLEQPVAYVETIRKFVNQ
jgi:pimeloyl-ACP methyl ester carboxylesterase